MAFADMTITVNSVAQALKRVSSGIGTGTFRTNDGNFELSVQHTYSKRARHSLVLKQRKIAADPLISANNAEFTTSFRITVDGPLNQGFTVAEQKLLWDGLAAFLAASSGAAVTSLLGGEN